MCSGGNSGTAAAVFLGEGPAAVQPVGDDVPKRTQTTDH